MTNKKNKALLFVAILAVPVLAAVAMILRAVALFTAFDGEIYFLSLSSLPSAFVIFSIAALLIFLLFSILTRKGLSTGTPERSALSLYFSSAFLAITLLALAFVSVLAAVSVTAPIVPVLHALLAVFAVISVVYFLLFLRNTTVESGTARAYFALSPAILSLMAAVLLYFDRSTQMNSPAKLLSLATFIALAIAFLVECRAFAVAPTPARRYLSLAIGFFFSISASLPNLLYTLVNGRELMLSSAYDFVLFAFALYFLSRLLEMLPEREKETHPLVRDVCETAEEEPAEKVAEEEAEEPTLTEEAPTEEPTVKKPRAKKKAAAEEPKTEQAE